MEKARETRELLLRDRDAAERAVLRQEPPPAGVGSALPAMLLLGFGTGGVLISSWLDSPFGRLWPRTAVAFAFGASSLWLLRSAWRIGRVSGARGA